LQYNCVIVVKMNLPDDVLSQQIDESINKFLGSATQVRKIKSEKNFVYETAYHLTNGKSVFVGLSVTRDFSPSVRFTSRVGEDVVLSVAEFCGLSKRLNLLENHLVLSKKGGRFEDKEDKFENVIIQFTSFNGKNVVKIKSSIASFDVDRTTFQQLHKQLNLIFYRIQMLQQLNFKKFYQDCLHSIVSFTASDLNQNLLAVCSNIKNSENVYCLREVLLNHGDIVEADFNLIKLYSD